MSRLQQNFMIFGKTQKILFSSSSFQTVNEIEEEHSRRRVRSRRGRGKKKQDIVQQKAAVAVEEPVSVKYDPGAANSMQWTKKYAPQSAAEVVGNAGVVAQLRQWLEEWSARNRRRRGGGRSRSAGATTRSSCPTMTFSTFKIARHRSLAPSLSLARRCGRSCLLPRASE